MIKQFFNLVCTALLAGSVSGCAAVGAIAAKTAPPPTVDAEYKPAKKPTLVFVESFENPDLYEVESERIARDIGYEFTEHKTFPVVSPEKVIELKSARGSAFSKMDVPSIAKAVGADQVIYVNLLKFTAEPPTGSETVQGESEATVKLVDAHTGEILFPRDSSMGRDVSYKTPALSEEGTTRDAVQQQLYKHLSEDVSHLFYDWMDEQQGDNGPPPITGNDIK